VEFEEVVCKCCKTAFERFKGSSQQYCDHCLDMSRDRDDDREYDTEEESDE